MILSSALRLKPLALALCGALSFGAAQAQSSERIIYDGTAASAALLREINGTSDSLGPANLDHRTGNTITINYDPSAPGVTNIDGYVMGAFDNAANPLERNSVSLVNGRLTDYSLLGAYSTGSGNVSNNTVTVSGGYVDNSVFGGRSGSGDVTGNTVTVSGGEIDGNIFGGRSESGNVTGNTVTVSGGEIDDRIYGGWSYSGSGNATGNTVTVSGGEIDGNIFGGRSGDNSNGTGNATNNTVTVSGGEIDGNIFGGWTYDGDAVGNTVTVSGGEFDDNITGGRSYNNGDARGNTVTVSGGNVDDSVFGGRSGYGDAMGNTVAVSGGYVGSSVIGGWTVDGNASNNTAIVSGGSVGSSVYGGRSGSSNATNNTAIVSGGSVGSSVYGGYSGCVSNNTPGDGNATDNTVIISGTPTFANATNFYGGFSGSGDARTGNRLDLHTTSPITVNNIANFQHLRLGVPNSSIASGTPALTLTDAGGTNISTPPGDPATTTVGVSVAGGSNTLQAGQSFNLIHNTNGLTTDAYGPASTITGSQGLGLLYDMTIANVGNTLTATVAGQARANPRAKSLSEGRIGGAAFVNQGADMVAGMGMERALAAAQSGVNGFGGISGGKTRHKSGSHVDVKGVNLLLGAATNLPNSAGNLMLGGFFEAGWGNYDSFNSFTNGNVKASGDNRYYGAGVLARQDFASKLYVEGSARAGKLDNDYASSDLVDGFGNTASYKLKKAYYGLHLGVGYQLPVGTGEVDFSAKYLFTQQKGGDTVVAGDTYSFKSINSQRSRLGAMYKHPLNANATLKLGAAWEHEFDGKAKASVHGVNLATPEIKGSSAVLEAGISYKPQSNSKLSIEAGVQGYAGKRQGATGNVAVKYLF